MQKKGKTTSEYEPECHNHRPWTIPRVNEEETNNTDSQSTIKVKQPALYYVAGDTIK